MIIAQLARKWLLDRGPDFVLETGVDADQNVLLTVWTPDKNKILKKFVLSPSAQSNLIARVMPLLEEFNGQ